MATLRRIEVPSAVIERALGAPVPIVPLAPPPVNALELGLLELEEDVLRDEYLLAHDTFERQLAAWRAGCDLDRLREVGRRYEEAGTVVDRVRWDGLATWSDASIDYAFRATRSIGATAIVTDATPDGHARLAPFATAHQLTVIVA